MSRSIAYGTVKLRGYTKGLLQVTIPKFMRETYKLEAGQEIWIYAAEDGVVLSKSAPKGA